MVLQVQHAQRAHCVGMGATDRHQADRCIVAAEDAAVQAVGARPGERGRNPFINHAPL